MQEKEMRLEVRFFYHGKFVGASYAVLYGSKEDIESLINDRNEIDEPVLEFMANRAGVGEYDVYGYECEVSERKRRRTNPKKRERKSNSAINKSPAAGKGAQDDHQ